MEKAIPNHGDLTKDTQELATSAAALPVQGLAIPTNRQKSSRTRNPKIPQKKIRKPKPPHSNRDGFAV